MLSNPRVGQSARVHYNARVAPVMTHHGKVCKVVVASRPHRGIADAEANIRRRLIRNGVPRRYLRGPLNHGVEIDGRIVCVPCGNLNGFKERW